jgi:hypothetical protein
VSFAVERGHVVGVCERRHRSDELVVHLLVVGVKRDRPVELFDRAPQVVARVREQQISVVPQQLRIARVGGHALVQWFGGEVVLLLSERFVALEQ